jgi:hypothetical protein
LDSSSNARSQEDHGWLILISRLVGDSSFVAKSRQQSLRLANCNNFFLR